MNKQQRLHTLQALEGHDCNAEMILHYVEDLVDENDPQYILDFAIATALRSFKEVQQDL